MNKSAEFPDECLEALQEALDPEFFKAFCDPVRVSIVATLAASETPLSVSDIESCCKIDFSGVSRHLKQLKTIGAVTAERRGRLVLYRLEKKSLVATLRSIANAMEMCGT
ncbi:MAG: metalloregulator ArsR/SmtB family transcription factor [Pseudomonadota bacterium]